MVILRIKGSFKSHINIGRSHTLFCILYSKLTRGDFDRPTVVIFAYIGSLDVYDLLGLFV